MDKLKHSGDELLKWNRDSFENVQKRIKFLMKKIHTLRQGPRSEESVN